MGQADVIYNGIVEEILLNGIWDKGESVRTKWADGTPAYTKSIISTQMKFDGKEVPLLNGKKVAWKTAIKEILKFWKEKTNSFESFHKDKIKIWDEWMITEGEWAGTIGPSYGYQMGLPCRKVRFDDVAHFIASGYLSSNYITIDAEYILIDQVDYLLWQIKVNPSSRRLVTSLWNILHLDKMALNPCVWNSQWLPKNKELHTVVGVRSNDIALGNPFNVFQYYVLQRMIAQVTGYELGSITFNINDAHIYERHIEGLQEQIKRQILPAPILNINPDVKSFYDFTIDDFELVGYEPHDSISFEVAI